MALLRSPTAARALLLMRCERFTLDVLDGKQVDDEHYRRNVEVLGGLMVKPGMAAESRDITKRDRVGMVEFGAALIEANAI